MKPIARRVFNFAAMFSLLMFVTSALLWWRSTGTADFFVAMRPAPGWGISSALGEITFNAKLSGTESIDYLVGLRNHRTDAYEYWWLDPIYSTHWPEIGRHRMMFTISGGITPRQPSGQYADYIMYHPPWQPPSREQDRILRIRFPHWLVLALSGIFPSFWIATRIRRRTRIVTGCCIACGYDLRATPDRCPECGTATAAAREGKPRVSKEVMRSG